MSHEVYVKEMITDKCDVGLLIRNIVIYRNKVIVSFEISFHYFNVSTHKHTVPTDR